MTEASKPYGNRPATPEEIRVARAIYQNDDVEIDGITRVSDVRDHEPTGRWVMAWVWVGDEILPLTEKPEDATMISQSQYALIDEAFADAAIAKILATLNEAVALDARAITCLMEQRVVCNDALAAHPTIQVQGGIPDASDPIPALVGPIGLMCGFVERLKPGFRLVATFGDDGVIRGFGVTKWSKGPL